LNALQYIAGLIISKEWVTRSTVVDVEVTAPALAANPPAGAADGEQAVRTGGGNARAMPQRATLVHIELREHPDVSTRA